MHGKRLILLMGLFSLAAGCDSPESEANLVGRYLCQYSYGIELLMLRSEGKYTQIVDVDATNGTVVHHGKWRYDIDGHQLTLVDALLVDDFFGHLNPDFATPASGLSSFLVKNTFSGPKFILNPDLPHECHRL